LADTLQSLFGPDADQTARETGFVQRQRKLSGATFLQTLTFTFLDNPHATLGDLGDVAETLDVQLSRQGFDQRFTPHAFDFLWAMLQQALQRGLTAAQPVLPLLRRFNGTYVLDSSTITLPPALAALLPGCGGQAPGEGAAACKVQVCLEMASGQLEDLALLDGRTNDLESALAHRPLPPGALRLADLGFYDLHLLQRYSDEDVFWISRLHSGTRVYSADGQKHALLEFLQALPAAPTHDVSVHLGAAQLPARLLTVRVPAEVANRRRQRLRRQASKRGGGGVSAERLALCDWDVLVTNVPAERLTLAEVWALPRVRWQVELLFKVWKGQGHIDALAGRKPYRVLCELAASWRSWCSIGCCWCRPARACSTAINGGRAACGGWRCGCCGRWRAWRSCARCWAGCSGSCNAGGSSGAGADRRRTNCCWTRTTQTSPKAITP
jgi:hypothetical protein